MTRKRLKRLDFWFPWLFVAINIIVKAIFLTANPVALDEPFSVLYAQMPLKEIWTELLKGNNPPLYEVLLHFWIKLVGTDPVSLRLPSLIAAAFIPYFLYRMVRILSGVKAAVLAGVLVTLSTFHTYFAHEARVYAIFALLTSAAYFLYFSYQKRPNTRAFVALILINLLLLYSHYFGTIVVLSQVIGLVWISKKERKALLMAIIIPLIGFLPVIHKFLNRVDTTFNEGTWIDAPSWFSPYTNLAKFSNMPVVGVLGIIILIIGLAFAFFNYRKVPNKHKQLAYIFVIPYFGLYMLSFYVPLYLDRYLIFSSIPFYALLAITVFRLPLSNNIQLVFAGLLLIGFGATYNPKPGITWRPDLAVQKVKTLEEEGVQTCILIAPEWRQMNFAYHYKRTLLKSGKDELLDALNHEMIYPIDRLTGKDPILQNCEQVIYFKGDVDGIDPEGQNETILENLYNDKEVFDFPGYTVIAFKNRHQ